MIRRKKSKKHLRHEWSSTALFLFAMPGCADRFFINQQQVDFVIKANDAATAVRPLRIVETPMSETGEGPYSKDVAGDRYARNRIYDSAATIDENGRARLKFMYLSFGKPDPEFLSGRSVRLQVTSDSKQDDIEILIEPQRTVKGEYATIRVGKLWAPGIMSREEFHKVNIRESTKNNSSNKPS